jgi:hypothetical protein
MDDDGAGRRSVAGLLLLLLVEMRGLGPGFRFSLGVVHALGSFATR